MSGHSHWKQIKLQKAVTDKKKSASFAKILNAISIAARSEPNPDFNPRLRTCVQKAREAQVPQENIDRAIQKAKDKNSDLNEIILECYGPGGIGILISAVSDNTNRTVNDLKLLLKEHGARLAEPGSVRWGFEPDPDEFGVFKAKFPQDPGAERDKLNALVSAIEDLEDIQFIATTASQ